MTHFNCATLSVFRLSLLKKLSQFSLLGLIGAFLIFIVNGFFAKPSVLAQEQPNQSFLFIPVAMNNHLPQSHPEPSPTAFPDEPISVLITPESGGMLVNPDSSVQISFPGGAVDKPVTVSYYYLTAPSYDINPMAFAGISFLLTATYEDGNPVTVFIKPFSIMITYRDEDLLVADINDESTLNIYYWDEVDWYGLLPCEGCHRNPVNNRIVASLDFTAEFTLLGMIGDPATPTPANTSTPAPSITPTVTSTPPVAFTPTFTPSLTSTMTHTTTPTLTPTATGTSTATNTPSITPTVTIIPTEMPSPGDPGFALEFDGNNDFVELHKTKDMLAEGWESLKSVSLWVKPMGEATLCDYQDVAKCDNIFGDRPRWWGIARGVRNDLDRIWVWNFDGNYDIISVPYTSDEWVQITMVHSGGILTAYKDGLLIGSIPSGETIQPPADPILHIGAIITGDIWPFEGQIDEVRLWNIALTQEDILSTLYWPLNGDEPGLAAYYAMSDGEGLILTDDSGNGWNGTLYDGGHGVPPDGSPPEWVDSGAFSLQLQMNSGLTKVLIILSNTWEKSIDMILKILRSAQ